MTEPAPATAETAPRPPRKQPRDARRVQLIEATIVSLARNGYARTTLTEVARIAGLSHGLVNFHFATKENLLAETLRYLTDEYRRNWETAVACAGDDPALRLDALLRADFNPAIYTPERLSAWCSFWGETTSRPLYQEVCGDNDRAYAATLETLCEALLQRSGADGSPVRIARVLRVVIEGVWLDMMTIRVPYPPSEALASVMACAAAFFPGDFGPEGARARAAPVG